jgi:hypothetical protein
MVAVSLALRRKLCRDAAVPALLVGLLLTGCQRPEKPAEEEPVIECFPGGALQQYLPGDTAAVFTLDVKRWRETSAAGKGLHDTLQYLFGKDEMGRGWLPLTGIEPLRDLDEVRLLLSSHAVFDPLVILRGRFDPSCFQTGAGELSRCLVDAVGSRFALFEYHDRWRGEIVALAPAGEYLVVCDARAPVLAALRHAAAPSPTASLDRRLSRLLEKVDRRHTFWLAVSLEQLRPVPKLNNKALELILRPILQYADSIEGGLTLADEMRAEFVFQTRNEVVAQNLEELLRSSCDVAQGVPLLSGVDPALRPLFQLAGSGEVTREGTALRLRCRLAEE